MRRRRAAEPRHQLLRLDFERLELLRGDGDLAARAGLRQQRQRRLRPAFGVGVAAAVEVGLRQDVGLGRLRLRLRVDQRDLERRSAVLALAEVEGLEADRKQHRVDHDRHAERVDDELLRAGEPAQIREFDLQEAEDASERRRKCARRRRCRSADRQRRRARPWRGGSAEQECVMREKNSLSHLRRDGFG